MKTRQINLMMAAALAVFGLCACGDEGTNATGTQDTTETKEQSSGGSACSGSALVDKTNWVFLNPAVDYGEMTDERDCQVYKTVKVGNQVWMAENLNYEYKAIMTDVPNSAYCVSQRKDCSGYGRYYTWAAAMDSAGVFGTNGSGCGDSITCTPTFPVRGICPKGWHLPDSTEWSILYNKMGEMSVTLKSMGFPEWTDATNYSGFSVIPGFYDSSKIREIWRATTRFWTASEKTESSSWQFFMTVKHAIITYENKQIPSNIRCLKD